MNDRVRNLGISRHQPILDDVRERVGLCQRHRRRQPYMGKDYELAVYSKDDFVWDKTDLLVPASSTPGGAS